MEHLSRYFYFVLVSSSPSDIVAWSSVGMRMADPVPTFTYLVTKLAQDHPDLAFLHQVEPGLAGGWDIDAKIGEVRGDPSLSSSSVALTFMDRAAQSNDFIRKIWLPRPLISAGRYTRESAIARAEETGELTAFGRLFISNVRCLSPSRAMLDSAHRYDLLARPSSAVTQEFAFEWLGQGCLPPAGGTSRIH